MKKASPKDDEINAQILGDLAHNGVTEIWRIMNDEFGQDVAFGRVKRQFFSISLSFFGNFSNFQIKKRGNQAN
jgi:hypothetical protein